MERGSWESWGKFWRWFSCRWAEDVWKEPLHREKPSHSNEMFFSKVGFYWLSSNKGGHERECVTQSCMTAALQSPLATLWGMKAEHMISNLIIIKSKSMNQLRHYVAFLKCSLTTHLHLHPPVIVFVKTIQVWFLKLSTFQSSQLEVFSVFLHLKCDAALPVLGNGGQFQPNNVWTA